LLSLKAGANIQRFFFPNQNFFRKNLSFFLMPSASTPHPQQAFYEHPFVSKAGANI